MQRIFDAWNCRNLTLFVKCLVMKSLGFEAWKTFIQNLSNSVGKRKIDLIQCRVMIFDYDKGGLHATSVDAIVKSFKLVWIPAGLLSEASSYWTNLAA